LTFGYGANGIMSMPRSIEQRATTQCSKGYAAEYQQRSWR